MEPLPRSSPIEPRSSGSGSLPPIPTPPAQRWREFRIQALPVLTFLVVLVCVAFLWHSYVIPTNIVGEVEAIHAPVISSVPGTIKELKVKRFQRVSLGEEIAQITTMDTETLQTSLRMIEANLKLMRARMQIDVERNQLSYEQARFDYFKDRIDLAIERVNARLYELEVASEEQLLTNTPAITSRRDYNYWSRLASTARTNVIEREAYLADKEKTLPKLIPATQADVAVLDAIRAEEENLRATAQTISLKSPIDGMVTTIALFQGQKIVPNLPIVIVSATNATRIVGYVRRPFGAMPKPNDTVQIRRQSFSKREVAQGTVVEVGGQLEPIPLTLVPPVSGGAVAEMGLPFAVSIPAELALIPGEPVDLIFSR